MSPISFNALELSLMENTNSNSFTVAWLKLSRNSQLKSAVSVNLLKMNMETIAKLFSAWPSHLEQTLRETLW